MQHRYGALSNITHKQPATATEQPPLLANPCISLIEMLQTTTMPPKSAENTQNYIEQEDRILKKGRRGFINTCHEIITLLARAVLLN